MEDPFKPVDKIDGIELSWTLGKMVLYAAGQVPPQGTALPVGFGTNVEKGTPGDFEHAGSVPIGSHAGDDDDDDRQSRSDIAMDYIDRPGHSSSETAVSSGKEETVTKAGRPASPPGHWLN